MFANIIKVPPNKMCWRDATETKRWELMQIAGSRCKACGGDIVLSSEGKACSHCNTSVHLTCDRGTTCGICGQPYQFHDRPEDDPLSGALLPPALRPAKSGGQMFALFVAIVLALGVILIWFAIEYGGCRDGA